MSERIDVCNKALSMLGEKPITSIDEDSNNAQQLKIHYQTARDACLEAHEWSFAIQRFVPSPLSIAPVYGATYQFPVPPEILRVLTVENPNTYGGSFNSITLQQHQQVDWVYERGMILCDEEVIYCRGIRRVEEEGRFSQLFVETMSAKLAALIAINLTGSAEIQANMLNFYGLFIQQAKSRDGLQGRSKRFVNKQLQSVR